MNTRYPEIEVQLTGEDGNAFAILAAVKRALRKADVGPEQISEFREQAMSGDYDNLLRVVMNWVSVR